MLINEYIWLIVMIIAAIIEAATSQIVSIWVVFAALAALFTSFMTDDLSIQLFVFAIVLVLSLVLLMPILRKKSKVKITKTNADKYIGQQGLVLEDIDNLANTGQVKVCGSIWTARSKDNSIIHKNSKIVVSDISGVKLIVDNLKNKEI